MKRPVFLISPSLSPGRSSRYPFPSPEAAQPVPNKKFQQEGTLHGKPCLGTYRALLHPSKLSGKRGCRNTMGERRRFPGKTRRFPSHTGNPRQETNKQIESKTQTFIAESNIFPFPTNKHSFLSVLDRKIFHTFN